MKAFPKFPDQTAKAVEIDMTTKRPSRDVDVPNLGKVWLQTLNDIHRSEALRDAGLKAAVETARVRKEPYRSAQEIAFRDLDRDELIRQITASESARGTFFTRAVELVPNLPPPERREKETDEEYTDRVAQHQELEAKYGDELQAKIAELQAKYEEGLAGKSDDELSKKMMTAYFAGYYASSMMAAHPIETLLRAVRYADDHHRQFFTSSEAIADLDDDVREFLWGEYQGLDSVKPEEVPT